MSKSSRRKQKTLIEKYDSIRSQDEDMFHRILSVDKMKKESTETTLIVLHKNEAQETSMENIKEEDLHFGISNDGRENNSSTNNYNSHIYNITKNEGSDMNRECDEVDESQKKMSDQNDAINFEKKESDPSEVATETIFICSVCNELFETKEKVVKHKRENTECHEHKQCDNCEMQSEEGFSCIWDLMQHLEKEHQVEHKDDLDLLQIQNTEKEKNDGRKDLNSCNVCQKSFHSKYTLRTHQMVHTGQKPLQCIICNTSCTTRSKLKVHMLIHSEKRPFPCSFCDRSFSFKYKCIQHEKTHTDQKPFKCVGCEKSFSTDEELQEHGASLPEGKPLKCRFCCKSFTYASKCMEHERFHTGEKPFQCEFCDKSFSLRSTAKKHQRTHTGERPYVCRFCQQTFPFDSSWREHELSHSVKIIPCSICSKTFSCVESAKKHESVHLRKSLGYAYI